MSEGQPLDVVSNPPREVTRSDILPFESEQERSPEPQQQLQELLQRFQERLQQVRLLSPLQLRRQQQPQQQQEQLQQSLQWQEQLQPPQWLQQRLQQRLQQQLRQELPMELLQQLQLQELYQQPHHQQRYYLNFQPLVTAAQYIGLHRFRLCCSPYYDALSSFMLFLSETLSMLTGANEITRGFLFLGTNGVVIHQLTSVNSFTFEKRNELSFGEAFSMSLPPMVHISMILLSLALNFVLLFRVYPGIQCVLLLLCILMPLYYFAELAHKAASIAVNLGSYKMPLIWFSTLGGLGISLIGGSMVLLIVFLSWQYARRRRLEFQGIRVNGDAIIGAMNA